MYSNCEANAIQNPILKIVGEKILLVLSSFALTENNKKTKSSKNIETSRKCFLKIFLRDVHIFPQKVNWPCGKKFA